MWRRSRSERPLLQNPHTVLEVPPVAVENVQLTPVAEYMTPAPAVMYAVAAPVVEYVTPAPAVMYAVAAHLVEYMTLAPTAACVAAVTAMTAAPTVFPTVKKESLLPTAQTAQKTEEIPQDQSFDTDMNESFVDTDRAEDQMFVKTMSFSACDVSMKKDHTANDLSDVIQHETSQMQFFDRSVDVPVRMRRPVRTTRTENDHVVQEEENHRTSIVQKLKCLKLDTRRRHREPFMPTSGWTRIGGERHMSIKPKRMDLLTFRKHRKELI